MRREEKGKMRNERRRRDGTRRDGKRRGERKQGHGEGSAESELNIEHLEKRE